MFKIKRIQNVEDSFRKDWKYGIAFAGYGLLLFNPMDSKHTKIQEFNRIIGNGVASGYDVSRVISNFGIWFLIFAVLMLIFPCFVHSMKEIRVSDEQNRAWTFLDDFVILAIVNLVLCLITFFNDETQTNIFFYSTSMTALVIIAVFGYIGLKLDCKISFKNFQMLLWLVLATSFPVAVLANTTWKNGVFLFVIQTISVAVMILVIKFAVKHKEKQVSIVIQVFTVASGFLPLELSIYIELVNILVGRGVYITQLKKWYAISVCMMIFLSGIFAVILKKVNRESINVKRIYYPVFIFGIASLAKQIPLTTTYGGSIFEHANFGVLISDFLNYGTLPIVEHYGGHMMSNVWAGILYGLLNNDNVGAAFSPYASIGVVIVYVAFFFVIKNIWNEDTAFWITILFPFYNAISYYGMGLLVVLAVISFIKKNSYFRALIVWLSCIWCASYRLDLGYAFGIACVLSLIIYIVCTKKKKATNMLIITLLLCVFVFAGLGIALCSIANVNPVSRLKEFLEISASNQNWAYDNIGNSGNFVYSYCYIFIPIGIAISLLYIIVSKKMKEKLGISRWIVLLILGIAYFANFSRGLVRHGVAEMIIYVVLWTVTLYFSIFVSCVWKRQYFLPVFVCFMLLNNLFVTDGNFSERSVADGFGSNISAMIDSWSATTDDGTGEAKTYWTRLRDNGEHVERVVVAQELQDTVAPLQEVLELLLEEDETYLDFINRTFSYCLLQKKDPVYISQSPMQLSGEYTQERLIAEIEAEKETVPLVVLPLDNNYSYFEVDLDGVENYYRYYKISEYIYQNYVPLCYNGDYVIWCLQERRDEMCLKVKEWNQNQLIDYGYDRQDDTADDAENADENTTVYLDTSTSLHQYHIRKLGQIWGELDVEKACDNPVFANIEPDGAYYRIVNAQQIDKTEGNYLLINMMYAGTDAENAGKEDDEETTATVRLGVTDDGTFVEKYRYDMTVSEGQHTYVIRCSCDYFWYSEDIDTIQIDSDSELSNIQMRILQGD